MKHQETSMQELWRGVLPPIGKSFDRYIRILDRIFIWQLPKEIAFGSIQRDFQSHFMAFEVNNHFLQFDHS